MERKVDIIHVFDPSGRSMAGYDEMERQLAEAKARIVTLEQHLVALHRKNKALSDVSERRVIH